MPDPLLDQEGRQVTIGRQIGRRGGEGSAYEASSHPGCVVKIYHEPPTDDKAAKLWHLTQLAQANPKLLNFAAWPTSIVWKGQKPRGFIMPLVRGKEVHQLFGPRERFVEFPSAGWDFLVQVARNCAAAFDSIHNIGVVVGDVNEGNILVAADGTVRLIDCDSYQVQHNGHLWTCDVGIPLWTPPELHGRSYRGLRRTPNHDLFGLAVMIFKLLMMGRHPFAGIPTNPSKDFVLEKAIANYLFAFSPRSGGLGIRPPPHCLSLATFPPGSCERFEQAFMRGSEAARPTAAQWAQALESLLTQLSRCGRDPSHKYPRNFMHCPWCEIAGSGGPNFFVSVTVAGIEVGANAGDLWSAIARVEEATITVRGPGEFSIPAAVGTPCPANIVGTRPQFIIGCVLFALAALLVFSGVPVPAIGAGLFAWGFMSGGMKTPEFQAERQRRQRALDQANADYSHSSHQLAALPAQYLEEFAKRRTELRQAYERYARLDRERSEEMNKLEQKKRELQLREYLDRQLITRAGITGIGPGRAATLQAYGIESALDVTGSMSVPGIGPTYYHRLMEWRRHCESRFRYNAAQPIPAAEIHQLNVRMATLRNQLLSDLKQGPQLLLNLTGAARGSVVTLEAQIDAALRRRAQAAADLRILTN